MKTQLNLFDFLEQEQIIQTTKSIKPQDIKLINIDYSHIPTMGIDVLLEQMKNLIEKGVMKQTDKYFRLSLSYEPHIIQNEFDESYSVIALAWSDSAIYNYVFENGGRELSSEDYLNTCDSFGAYTKRAWQILHDDKNTTPKDFMEIFKIKEHIRPISFANGSKEDCETALHILIDWNKNHITSITELQSETKFNFIRISRRKGEIERTRCMNGECIGSYLMSENAY